MSNLKFPMLFYPHFKTSIPYADPADPESRIYSPNEADQWSWDQIIEWVRHPRLVGDKHDAPLWQSVTFRDWRIDSVRKTSNVEYIHVWCVDIDDCADPDRLISFFNKWRFVLYPSFSYFKKINKWTNKPDQRMRMLIPLAEPTLARDFTAWATRYIDRVQSYAPRLEGGDKTTLLDAGVTTDIARISFVPSLPLDSEISNLILHNDGPMLSIPQQKPQAQVKTRIRRVSGFNLLDFLEHADWPYDAGVDAPYVAIRCPLHELHSAESLANPTTTKVWMADDQGNPKPVDTGEGNPCFSCKGSSCKQAVSRTFNSAKITFSLFKKLITDEVVRASVIKKSTVGGTPRIERPTRSTAVSASTEDFQDLPTVEQPDCITIDFETRSKCDLRKRGLYSYASDPSTEILCLAWLLPGEEQPKLWHPAIDGLEEEGLEHLLALFGRVRGGELVESHNAEFELAIWNEVLTRVMHQAPKLKLSQLQCSMAKAQMLGLPASLANAAKALRVDQRKDEKASKLMRKMARDNTSVWSDEEWYTLFEYCRQDVRAEHAVSQLLLPLPKKERLAWEHTVRLNKRGIPIDLPRVRSALKAIEQLNDTALGELARMTGGEVTTFGQGERLRTHLAKRGLVLENARATTIASAINLTDDSEIKALLSLWLSSRKSSTAKFKTIAEYAGTDDRVRGTLRYHAAHTGRWAGQGVQPQNLPRSSMLLEEALDNPSIEAFSQSLRSALRAPEGKTLVAADYSSIETRILWSLAGEETGLGFYREGRNPYIEFAAKIFDRPADSVDKSMHEYQIGKQGILSLGFGAGGKKFAEMCGSAGVPISMDEAAKVVETYRSTFPAVKKFWADQERAAMLAIDRDPYTRAFETAQHIKWDRIHGWLRATLPSGRSLYYFQPQKVNSRFGGGHLSPAYRSGQAAKLNETYGGKLVENIVQAVARDILLASILNAEKSGWKIVLTAHDEIVCEEPEHGRSHEELADLMCRLPRWARNIPITAEGWTSKVFKK